MSRYHYQVVKEVYLSDVVKVYLAKPSLLDCDALNIYGHIVDGDELAALRMDVVDQLTEIDKKNLSLSDIEILLK